MAPVAWFFLPDSPHKARFLAADEKQAASAREVRQVGTDKRIGGLVWRDVGRALLDPKAWLQALMLFSCNAAYGSLPVFLPTILRESLHFSAIDAQGLTAPPYLLSFFLTWTTCWIADRIQQRGYMVAGLSMIAGVGYVMLATLENVWVEYFAIFLIAAGIFPAIGNILPWVTNNQGSDSGRGVAVVIINVVGQCGPVLGTKMYPTTDAPGYVRGHCVCAGFLFFNAFLALTLRAYLSRQNRKLDATYGPVAEVERRASGSSTSGSLVSEAEKSAANALVTVGVENYGPTYRYVL